MKALIIDDTKDLHSYYRIIVGKKIKDIDCASNELEVFQLLALNQYDFILSDIHMSPMSGPSILRRYKEAYKSKVVLISCADNIEEIAESLKCDGINVVGCVGKPIMPKELYELLK